jgi:hypothetical protein
MIDPTRLGQLATELRKANCSVGKPHWLALAALLQAAVYAQDVQRDIWDFSLGLRELREFGLNLSDIRWLLCKGYIEQAEEIGNPKAKSRSLQKVDTLCVLQNGCFALTNLGIQTALEWKCDEPYRVGGTLHLTQVNSFEPYQDQNGRSEMRSVIPKWDADNRMVTYAGVVVKQFKLPSPNQVAILAAFEEEGWPTRIDDPLPPRSDVDPKQRLHDTIRSINRNQRHKLLFFRGDGTGNGVIWMPRDGSSVYEEESVALV